MKTIDVIEQVAEDLADLTIAERHEGQLDCIRGKAVTLLMLIKKEQGHLPTVDEEQCLRPIGELVLVDLEKRIEFGREKYGGELLPFDDDVSPLVDAYEEALDLSLYLRQAIEEKRLLQGGYKPGDLPRRSVDEN